MKNRQYLRKIQNAAGVNSDNKRFVLFKQEPQGALRSPELKDKFTFNAISLKSNQKNKPLITTMKSCWIQIYIQRWQQWGDNLRCNGQLSLLIYNGTFYTMGPISSKLKIEVPISIIIIYQSLKSILSHMGPRGPPRFCNKQLLLFTRYLHTT